MANLSYVIVIADVLDWNMMRRADAFFFVS
ncbi:hypothetical protein X759_21005 [Mesorhizobium sp. LSHC420B00]|nr:hypothetical protein X759_21005 [Mesorhizobium sp. LSHC420B00]